MKKLILLCLLVVAATANLANAQTKRVLLEEFTGSWCGWCPRGFWAIEQLKETYGDKFIPIAFHNGDPMVFPTCDTLQATVTGYPGGWIDRKLYGSSLSSDPGTWVASVGERLLEPAKATVSISEVNFDPKTRIVTAKVTVDFVVAVTGDYRINMYLSEDSVSGPAGTWWDQTNYLTNRAGYEDNPFYNLPPTVANYQHMHVARAAFAGAQGLRGIIPATADAGTSYSAMFSYKIPNNIKVDHSQLIALVYSGSTVNSQKEVLNSDIAPVTTLPVLRGITASVPYKYGSATRAGNTDVTITVTNNGSSAATASLSVDEDNTSLPAGWSVVYTPSQVTLDPQGSALVTMTITAPEQSAYAKIMTSVMPEAEGYVGRASLVEVNQLTAGTKYISLDNNVDVMTAAVPAAYKNDFAVLPFNQDIVDNYLPQTYDLVVFPNIEFLDFAAGVNGPYPSPLSLMNPLIDGSKKIMVTSMNMLYNSFDAGGQNYNYCNTPEAEDFIAKLGISYLSQKSRHNSQGQGIAFPVTGIQGDVIGDGINAQCTDPYYSDLFTIDGGKSTPIFYFDNKTSTPAGVRYDDGNGQRIVYLGVRLPYIAKTNRDKIIGRSIEFLMNGTSNVKTSDAADAFTASNYPNPAVNATVINYSITERAPVSLVVRDLLGREVSRLVTNQMQDAGTYEADLNVEKLSAGSYIYTLTAGDQTISRTLNVTK